MPTTVSSENKIIARTAAAAFRGQPRVSCFWDDNRKNNVDLLACENQPDKGINSYSTIGLSDTPLLKEGRDIGLRLEFIGTCVGSCKEFENILSSAAFSIINSRWFCAPGVIFPDIVAMYKCSLTMKHLMFVPPFLWENDLKTLELGSKTVAWLLAIPISEDEFRYAELEGSERLQEIFEKNKIDIADINRSSVI